MSEEKKYYSIAKKASSHIGNHRGLLYIKKAANQARKILDLGCGEGTRLNLMSGNKKSFGVDIDSYAINLAKKQYPRHAFRIYDGKRLPYKDKSFDLVYSAFVLEHTQDPEKFLKEARRVVSPGGKLILLCPNFGAPNRRSPNSTQKPLQKLLTGFIDDLKQTPGLYWQKVNPKTTYGQIDDDTTVEPYLRTLESYLISNGLTVNKKSSLWELESFSANPRKLLFLTLGRLGLYPFRYWGPQLFIIAKK